MNKNIIKISINQRIKELRLEHKLTQREFSEKIGITRAALGQMETFVANPTLELVIKIVKEFGVTYDFLIDNGESLPKDTSEDLLQKEVAFLKKEMMLKDEIIDYQKQLIKLLSNNGYTTV